MSNLNDFLSGSYKQKKTRVTKSISGWAGSGSTYDAPGEEITTLAQSLTTVHNSTVVIRATFEIRYDDGQYEHLRIFRNTVPTMSAYNWFDQTNLVGDSSAYHYHVNGQPNNVRTRSFTYVDTNPGINPTYKFAIERESSNTCQILSATVHFDTYELFDLTD